MPIEKAVEELKKIMDSLCTHCGECCSKQAVFMTDVEAPIIAQSLIELGGTSLAKEHLKINSTIFNLWHTYVLQSSICGTPMYYTSTATVRFTSTTSV
ncbi:MAG: hypothetical protein ACXACT_17475 [Candidatus Thorarchaeota archaeon]